MLWRGQDEEWRNKRRRGVLGFWRELKLQLWDQLHGGCVQFKDLSLEEQRKKVLEAVAARSSSPSGLTNGTTFAGVQVDLSALGFHGDKSRHVDRALQWLRKRDKVCFVKGRWYTT